MLVLLLLPHHHPNQQLKGFVNLLKLFIFKQIYYLIKFYEVRNI